MPRPVVTRMVEDYLTLIWKAYEWPGGSPSTTDMAAQLGVTPSTVSANLKKLSRDGFISYTPYGRIELEDIGREIAVGIVRRHRLVETYLVHRLGLSWDQVHDEADRLEHAVSDLVLAAMDAALGHPTRDPHGDPIPTVDGEFTPDVSAPLVLTDVGREVEVSRVSDRSGDVLRFLRDRGVTPGVRMRVLDVNAAVGTVEVEVDGARVDLSTSVADAVRVVGVG